MFDFITRRRLIFCLVAFLFITISIIFIAHVHSSVIRHVIPSYYPLLSSNMSIDTEQQKSTCYLTESVEIVTVCEKCKLYERRSKASGCLPSGYREYVLCSKSKIKTYRSCPIPKYIQKQHFWLFQGIIFFIGLLAIASVHSRQKTLDKQMIEKIKKQIGESEG
jgi:hypothetical protein